MPLTTVVHPLIQLTPNESIHLVVIDLPVQATQADVIDIYNYSFSLTSPKKIVKIRVFLGVDQGNIGEFALDLSTNGHKLYNRSLHKETNGIYEAWDTELVTYAKKAQHFNFQTLAHLTSPKTGNIEFEIILELESK